MKRELLVALASSAVAIAGLNPAVAITQYHRESWMAKDGLPHNVVTAIAQTPDGYLWLGTELGLASFDGRRFVTYDRRNTPQLQSPAISALLTDHEGTLWIGTHGGGLTRYRDGQFQTFTTKNGLTSNVILSLLEARQGGLFIGTDGGGLNRFTGGRFSGIGQGLSENAVFALAEDAANTLWVGTHDGLNRLASGAGRFQVFTTKHGLAGNTIRSLLAEPDGKLWIGTDGGLSIYQGGHFFTPAAKDGVGAGVVSAIRRDGRGAVWFATVGRGLVRFANGGFSRLDARHGLPGDRLFAVFPDRDGDIWAGTIGAGLARLSDGMFTPFGKDQGLSQDEVGATFQDSRADLWIGTKGGGVNRIRDGRVTVFTTQNGLSDNRIYAIGEDAEGAVWIGTRAGIDRYANGRFSRRFAGQIAVVIHRARDGSMWAGTRSGLWRFEPHGNAAPVRFTGKDGLSNNNVLTIADSHDGGLWIGTGGGGVNKLKDGRFTVFNSRQGLSNDVVLSLHEDVHGVLWAGTDGGGLNRLGNGTFTAITSREGLFDDGVFQILEDGGGNFWMSCNRGVFRVSRTQLEEFVDHRRNRVTSMAYDTADGMESSECNGGVQPAGVRTSDGRLWFPTARGLAVVDPSRAAETRAVLPVIVEQVRIDSNVMPQHERIVASPGRGDLEIEYTSINFQSPSRTNFRYRLVGFDKGWTDAANRRSAFYTNIPPGSYQFLVESRIGDSAWPDQPALVRLRIEPVFYRQYWFTAFLLLASFAGVWTMHALSVRRLNERERELALKVEERTEELRLEVAYRKEAQMEALRAMQTAEDANRAKSEFLANISHEIRTPMNGIIGLTNLTLDGGLKPVERENLEGVKASAYGLLHLLNDILDLSKIEAGKLELAPVIFQPRKAVASVIQLVQPTASDKFLRLESSVAPEVPETLRGDDLRLRQVLLNLLNNAVKFTHRGCVSLRVRQDGPDLLFSVTDTGIGIARDRLVAIFQPFEQGDGSTTRRFGGTGLGLAISEKLTRMMGGRMWVESEPGVGSTFHFTVNMEAATSLPPRTPAAPDALQPAQAAEIPLRVLLAEDNLINQMVATRILEKAGHTVTVARDGAEAVTYASSEPFDCILMDVQMPRLDGLEATRRIRALGIATPIIAMTANAMKGDEELCLAAGMDAYLPKPFEPRQLAHALAQAIQLRAPRR